MILCNSYAAITPMTIKAWLILAVILGLVAWEFGKMDYPKGELPCEQVQQDLRDKLVEIDRQIQQLQMLKQEGEKLLTEREALPQMSEAVICPIVEQV